MATPPLALAGELTIPHAAALRAQLLEAVAEGCCHLDLAGITECDSAGVQLLVALHHSLAARGSPLVIDAASPPLEQCLLRYGLDSLLLAR